MQTIPADQLRFSDFIRPTDRVLVSHSTAEPLTLLELFLEQRTAYAGARLFMHASFSNTVRKEHADCLTLQGLGAVGTQRALTKAGVLDILPSHLSDFVQALKSGAFAVDAVLLQVSGPDVEGRYSLGLVNDYQVEALHRARFVIAELNAQCPFTLSEPYLTATDIDVLVPTDRPLIEIPPGHIGEIERDVANYAASYLQDGSVVQFGVGAIPDAIAAAMTGFRDIGVHSGVVPDAIMALIEAGAVTNARKQIDTGCSVTGAVWGTRKLYDFVAHNSSIKIRPLTYTHAPENFARLTGFVSFNSAIEVDLSGQANLEMAGQSYIGAVGGAVDFVRGARIAPAGRSIVALPSTAANGTTSRIVVRVGGPVTIARSDIDTVVTEFGRAELRGQPLAERARRMIAIAHPAFRDGLAAAAQGRAA